MLTAFYFFLFTNSFLSHMVRLLGSSIVYVVEDVLEGITLYVKFQDLMSHIKVLGCVEQPGIQCYL